MMKACTGDVTTDLVNQNDPNYQLGAGHGSTTFVTLSISGNDVQFSTILKACIFGLLPDCNDSVNDARTTLYGGVMHTNYANVINQILTRTAWQRRLPANKRTVIYQTGYSQFFDAYTDQCDGTSFIPYDGLNLTPKITKDLRERLNHLTHEVNYVLAFWVDTLNVQNSWGPTQSQPFTLAVNFADVDILYYSHRFCRDGVIEPDRSNPDTCFFHLLGRQGEPEYDIPANLTANSVAADMNKYYDNSTIDLATVPIWVAKTFHPTSEGIAATSF